MTLYQFVLLLWITGEIGFRHNRCSDARNESRNKQEDDGGGPSKCSVMTEGISSIIIRKFYVDIENHYPQI